MYNQIAMRQWFWKSSLVTFALLAALLFISGVMRPAQASPLAQLTPFPTPTPGSDGRIRYIVQPGDTLWRIAAITGVSLDDLRALNKLDPDALLNPGDVLVIGLVGPVIEIPTEGPSPTLPPELPTTTPQPGTANLFVLLYDDLNGDTLRQETEPVIPGGAVSVSDRLGDQSFTATTAARVDANCPEELELSEGYLCFMGLPEGEYIVTVAIPEGYNPTTVLSRAVRFLGGDETFMSFGAQPNSEKIAETALIPESPRRSPLLAIIGGIVLLIGAGLGVYALLLGRR